MYYIRADLNGDGEWTWLHYPADEECVAWDKKLKLALNGFGSLEVTYARTHPIHGRVIARRTVIEVLNDKESLFIGEVREIDHDRMLNESLYVVGALGWLENSIQGQEQFRNVSIRQFLQRLLSDHNAQCPEHKFYLGKVDVSEPYDADDETLLRYTNYGTTWATIKDRLIDRFDDTAVRLYRTGNDFYIDFVDVQRYGNECEQDVRFGENLLDYSDSLTTSDVCSSVVPLGATITDEEGNPSRLGNIIEKRVTIESVNGGKNYLESSALVQRFGHVRTTHTWDGVSNPTILKRKALAWLTDGQWERLSLKVRVADLTLAGEAHDALRVGDRAYVTSEAYGLRKVFPIRARSYDLDDPEQDELRLGADSEGSFVTSTVTSAATTEREQADSQYVMGDMLKNAIQNVTAMMTGSRGGYKYTEYDDQGRWVADYIMDSIDRETAQLIKKVTVAGTAYSTDGGKNWETAIMADGTILGKYIQANSIKAEQISTEYTKLWKDEDDKLNKTMTSLISGPNGIEAKVSTLRGDVFGDKSRNVKGLKADLEAAIKVNADNISLTVRKDGIQSAINQSADRIIVNASKFGWTSDHSSLTADGTLTTKNMVATNATITGVLTTVNSNGSLKTQMEAGIIKLYANNTVAGNIQGYRSSDGKYNTRIYGKNGVIISTGSGTITLDANKLVAGGYTGYTGWVDGVYYSCGLRTTRT